MSTEAMQPGTTYPAIVGATLAAIRKEKGYTQADFADSIGIVQSTWSRIEKGVSALNIEQLVAAAEALGIEPYVIIQRADNTVREIEAQKMRVEYQPKKSGSGGLLLLGAAALTALVIAANKNK